MRVRQREREIQREAENMCLGRAWKVTPNQAAERFTHQAGPVHATCQTLGQGGGSILLEWGLIRGLVSAPLQEAGLPY